MGARLQEFRFPGSRLVTPEPLCPYYCFWCTAPKHHQPSSKAFWWGCAHPPQFWSETHNFQRVKSPKTRKVWVKTIQLEFYFALWTRQRLCYRNKEQIEDVTESVSSAWVPSSAVPRVLQAAPFCTGLRDADQIWDAGDRHRASSSSAGWVDKSGEGKSVLLEKVSSPLLSRPV